MSNNIKTAKTAKKFNTENMAALAALNMKLRNINAQKMDSDAPGLSSKRNVARTKMPTYLYPYNARACVRE